MCSQSTGGERDWLHHPNVLHELSRAVTSYLWEPHPILPPPPKHCLDIFPGLSLVCLSVISQPMVKRLHVSRLQSHERRRRDNEMCSSYHYILCRMTFFPLHKAEEEAFAQTSVGPAWVDENGFFTCRIFTARVIVRLILMLREAG